MKEAEKRKLEEIETENSTRPTKQQKIEDNIIIQNSDEEIVDTDVSMPSTSPDSDSEKSIDYNDSPLGTPEQYIIDNFENQGDESAKPKHFTTNMFKDDIERFNEAREKGKEAESQFIQNYINEHEKDNVSSADDVYSLLLIASIVIKDVELTRYILSKPHNDILTYVDDGRNSAISAAFLSNNEEILGLINKYIKSNLGSSEKPDLSGKDKSTIFSITKNPSMDVMPADYFETYLAHLYSGKFLEELAGLIGLDSGSEELSD